jgi:hypothetical protein
MIPGLAALGSVPHKRTILTAFDKHCSYRDIEDCTRVTDRIGGNAEGFQPAASIVGPGFQPAAGLLPGVAGA